MWPLSGIIDYNVTPRMLMSSKLIQLHRSTHTNDNSSRPLNLDSSTGAGLVARNIFLTCFARAPPPAAAEEIRSSDKAAEAGMMSWRRNRDRSRMS